MIKEFTKNFPEAVKTRYQGALTTISNFEKELKVGYEKVATQAQALNAGELRKRFVDIQKKAQDTVGKAVNENLTKAYGVLNIPTRSEVETISKKVNKINQDIRKLADARTKAHKTVKKPVKKTATKKPAAKKPAKK